MITLYGYDPAFGMPSSSPFVVKTMIHLAMAGRPYEIEVVQDPSTAPKGKLPYIRDGDETIADSELIRKHLEQRYGIDFDPGLTAAEKADGMAFTRLVEDHLYWCAMYDHWQVDEHWAEIKPMFFGSLPPDQMDAVSDAVRAQIRRDLHGQGIGRHSPREVSAFGRQNIQTLGDRLGDGPYWFGDQPTSADAAIAPHIMAIAGDPLDGALSRAVAGHPSLVGYAKRVTEATIPDRLG